MPQCHDYLRTHMEKMTRGTLNDYYKTHNQLNNVSNKAYKVEVRSSVR